jgi:tRNA nucleotidyltransferase (CCA-adding enzyme)
VVACAESREQAPRRTGRPWKGKRSTQSWLDEHRADEHRRLSESGGAADLDDEDEPCNVVLTHTACDFDSLAGACALAKIWAIERPEYPTHVVMPRGANPLTKRFLAFHKHLLPVRGFSTIRIEDLRAVGVVDTQAAARLGPGAAWIKAAEYVAVVDHHTGVAGDIAADELVLEQVGSSTTILVEKLKALADSQAFADGSEPGRGSRPLSLTETEATLFALGIRADTGGLSFPDTTPRDAHALAWLMDHGCSQTAIAEFGQSRLSNTLRNLLGEAMGSVRRTEHEGLKVL